MGCGSSRAEDSRLLALCKERRDLIRGAVDCRHALADAHVAYCRALRGVGEALQRFAEEELAVGPTPPPGSPVLTIPSSEGKGGRSSGGYSIPVAEGSHLRFSDDSHLHLSEDEVEEEEVVEERVAPLKRRNTGAGYHYMMHSAGPPTTVYQSPPRVYSADDRYGRYGYYYGDPGTGAVPSQPKPVTPPPPEVPGWDFLDPFSIPYEQFYSQYSVGSTASSQNSSEVREREGIPQLEDVTEQEGSREVRRKGKYVDGGVSGTKDSDKGRGQRGPTVDRRENVKLRVFDDNQSNRSVDSECIASGSDVGESSDGEDFAKKEVTFEVQVQPEAEKSGLSMEAALSSRGTRGLREVVDEIKGLFSAAAVAGEDLWPLLEVGKLRYRSRKTAFKVVSSRLIISFRVLARSHPVLKQSKLSSSRTHKVVEAALGKLDKISGAKFGDLSSTLERLYIWEKRLYKEVKTEENLRVSYEKKFRHLRALDEVGAESAKIDSAHASVRKLLTKIDVVIKSIEAISTRIQKLRDEELKPQVAELVKSLREMWKALLHGHQRQFQAIVDSKTHNIWAKASDTKNSVAKATKELEAEILKWASCFVVWVNAQKSYVEALNGWLLRCLDVEPEVTPDGVVPFSPGRYGAPAVFVTCNDWHQVVDRNSEDDVTRTIHDFAQIVHLLWEKQDEERQQKLKAEYLSKDFARRLASLQKENTMPLHIQTSDANWMPISSSTNVTTDDRVAALDLMHKRVDEESAKHEKTLRQVHAVASSTLKTGLLPVFDALIAFTSKMLTSYEGIRLSSGND